MCCASLGATPVAPARFTCLTVGWPAARVTSRRAVEPKPSLVAAEFVAVDRPLILGSGSPRRRDLLTALGLAFEIAAADIDESALVSDDVGGAVGRIARAKFDALADRREHRGRRILTADTLVASAGHVLGKPSDLGEAEAMVRSMSGQAIEVATFVCVGIAGHAPRSSRVSTTLQLHDLTEDQIQDYLATGAAMDKAGALELQGAAAHFIASIDGCWSNVVGLPLCAVAELLEGAAASGSSQQERCSGLDCGASGR